MKRLRYFLIVGLAAYFLLEAALWLFFPLPPLEQKNLESYQQLPGLQPKVRYTSNRFGFRSMSMTTRKKPAGTIRIFAIGASTTDQMNQSTPDLWSAILEKKLNESFGGEARFEVAAWGRGGEKVFDRVRFMREELPRYEPDIVLALEGINDMAWNGGPGYSYEGVSSRLQGTNNKKKWYSWVKELKHDYSQVYRYLEKIEASREQREKLKSGKAIEYANDSIVQNHRNYLEIPYQSSIARSPDPFHEFSDGLDELAKESKRLGVDLIFLTQPVLWKEEMSEEEKKVLWFYVNTPEGPARVDPAWMAKEMRRYNEVQIAAAQKNGLDYVPLHERIPQTLEYHFDDCHLTDLGNQTVADTILPKLGPIVRRRLRAFNSAPIAQGPF